MPPDVQIHPAGAAVVEVDARDDLRSGREPFARIMAAVGALAPDQVLLVRAIFEPVPLFNALGKRGFAHESRQNAPDDWSAWFWRANAAPAAARAAAPAAVPASAPTAAPPLPNGGPPGTDVEWLDVRGLEPPEPLVRTLAALDGLPGGRTLVQVNVRVPQLLLPMLAERGYACEVDESHPGEVRVRIWRPSGGSTLR